MVLLGRLPHLVHPRLHLVSVGLCALRSPDVRVGVEHVATWAVRVWIGVDVAVRLRWRRHAVRRRRLPAHAAHMGASTCTSRRSLLHIGWGLEDGRGSVTRRMGGRSHTVRERGCGWCLLVALVVLASKVAWQRTVVHEGILNSMAVHVGDWRKLRAWRWSHMTLPWRRC